MNIYVINRADSVQFGDLLIQFSYYKSDMFCLWFCGHYYQLLFCPMRFHLELECLLKHMKHLCSVLII